MIKYLGSKRRLVPALTALAGASGARTGLDLFCGTTRVSQAWKAQGLEVTAVDSARLAHVLARCYVATDPAGRPGLLAEVTGVLALHGLNVRTANVAGEDGVAVEIFTVEPARGRWPSSARLSDDLAAVMAGKLSLDEGLAERARTYRHEKRASTPHLVAPRVTLEGSSEQ